MSNVLPLPRKGLQRAAIAVLLFVLAVLTAVPAKARTDNVPAGGISFERRIDAEKAARSRYRKLEVASMVLLLAGGGIAIFWVLRRK